MTAPIPPQEFSAATVVAPQARQLYCAQPPHRSRSVLRWAHWRALTPHPPPVRLHPAASRAPSNPSERKLFRLPTAHAAGPAERDRARRAPLWVPPPPGDLVAVTRQTSLSRALGTATTLLA